MDTNIGAKERVTQNRLIGLFKNVLKYTYLGNWETREGNANIEETLLTAYLSRRIPTKRYGVPSLNTSKRQTLLVGDYITPTRRCILCCAMA